MRFNSTKESDFAEGRAFISTDSGEKITCTKTLELWKRVHLRVKSKIMYTKMTENVTSLTESMKHSIKSLIHMKVSMPFGLIHPHSNVKCFWNCILIILLMYTATITPFRICFMDYIIFSQ